MIKNIFKVTFCLVIISALGCEEKMQQVADKQQAKYITIDHKAGGEIDSLLMDYNKKGKFNGNISVIKSGEILHRKSYGYSDSTKQILLETNYKFGIGSIFKEFPAVSIMKLKEKGLLNIEDKIDEYIPELPNWSEEITIKDLLQYTSGLPTINWNKYFSKNMAVSDEDILKDIMNIKELEFTPGSNYLYTNNSPFLLIKIIEKITKRSFNDYVEEELLIPAKMNETEIKTEYPYRQRSLMAFPLDSDFKEDQYKLNSPTLLFTSTINDLSNWFLRLNSYDIISKESVNFLAQTAALENENMQSPLGNCTLKEGKVEKHTHHGSMGNYECIVQRFNNEDITIAILTNQKNRNVFKISESIISILNKKN